jgi:hypothetical protein
MKEDNLKKIIKLNDSPASIIDENGNTVKTKRTALEDLYYTAKAGDKEIFDKKAKQYGVSWIEKDALKSSNILNNIKRSEKMIHSFTKYALKNMGMKVPDKKVKEFLSSSNYDSLAAIKMCFQGNKNSTWKIGNLTSAAGALANSALNIDRPFTFEEFQDGKSSSLHNVIQLGVSVKSDAISQDQPLPVTHMARRLGFETVRDFNAAKASVFQRDLLTGNLHGVGQMPPEILSSMLLNTKKELEKVIPADVSYSRDISVPTFETKRRESSNLISNSLKKAKEALDFESMMVPVSDYLTELGFEEKAQKAIANLSLDQIADLNANKDAPAVFEHRVKQYGLSYGHDNPNTMTPEKWKKNSNKIYHMLTETKTSNHNYSKMEQVIKISALGILSDPLLNKISKTDTKVKNKITDALSIDSKDSIFFKFSSDINKIVKELSKIEDIDDINNFVEEYQIEDVGEAQSFVSDFLNVAERARFFIDEVEDKDKSFKTIVDMFGFYKKNLQNLFPQMLEEKTQETIKNIIIPTKK